MIAQLKYGSGTPFYRLEQLEGQLGIPLPAATPWEIMEEAAELIKPARDELIRQAAQGEVVHHDDTSMRADEIATGLQTIVWRKSWEARQAAATKARLLQYNQDDCRALKHVFEFIRHLTSPGFATASVSQISVKTTPSEDLPKTRPRWEMCWPQEIRFRGPQKGRPMRLF